MSAFLRADIRRAPMPAINGAHMIIYSKDAEEDRAFLRDVLKLPYIDSGDGWLIFALPPSEIAVHPDRASGRQEIYLLCKNVEKFVASMTKSKVKCGKVQDVGWGRLTSVTLPGGGKVGVYEPRHARPGPKPKKKR